ncbi:MAG: glycoside hydrolase family 3 N-terminal domain-containing protein, partial [Bacteroidota bacterium]
MTTTSAVSKSPVYYLKKFFTLILWLLGGLISLILLTFLVLYISSSVQANQHEKILGKEAPSLSQDGQSFRDLNKNGSLDVYEDPRETVEARVEDLLGQMNLEEKAGLMFITMASMENDGSPSNKVKITNPFSLMLQSNLKMVAEKKMNHFNLLQSPSPEAMIAWNNHIQKLAERTRLGIPVTIATDPRHGVANAPGMSITTPFFSEWCSATGFGAIGDTALMEAFGQMAREEYKAVGIRLALSPMADLATEPRVARIGGMFSEDAQLAARLTKAYIKGFQGDSLDANSVSCVVKHFSGYGPQKDGRDPHFPPGIQVYPGGNFDYHLIPFEAAFDAGVSRVMPSYSIPEGITDEAVVFAYNKAMVTGLLREKYQFDGVIMTDYGIVTDMKIMGILFKPASAYGAEDLSVPERIAKIIDAGCDMIGGEHLPEHIVKLVKAGTISEERINASARRILREKFILGLFDNPYLEANNAQLVNQAAFVQKGQESQRRSLTLLKNDQLLPLDPSTKIHAIGFHEDDILPYEELLTSLEAAEVLVMKLNTPYEVLGEALMEKIFHQGRLDFTEEEQAEILALINTKPTVTVINLERPAVIPDINDASQAVIADFGSRDDIILDLIYGKFSPEGKLPFELPSSMEAVEKQLEDLPYDS